MPFTNSARLIKYTTKPIVGGYVLVSHIIIILYNMILILIVLPTAGIEVKIIIVVGLLELE